MTKLTFDITMSLDGFVAGPNQGPEAPLGEGGQRLHTWVYGLRVWREMVGLEGGETGRDGELLDEARAGIGAVIMGRGMFGGGNGPWDESWEGWWGEDPPYHAPVFVLTHHSRAPLQMQGGTTFTFVTDGIESALVTATSRSPEGAASCRSTSRPGSSTSSRCTSRRSCWAGVRGCSTTSAWIRSTSRSTASSSPAQSRTSGTASRGEQAAST